MPPEAEEVRRWLEKAEHDRAGAEAALARVPPVTDVAAFHCQQAVEKLLKAYPVHCGQEFERTHDLVELAALCGRHDPAFAAFQDRVAQLTPYAVRFRYPGPADPPLEEVEAALAVVEDVFDLVLARLPSQGVS